MKHIKSRIQFLRESKDTIKDDALHILATHDSGQPTEDTLNQLDKIKTQGKVVCRFAPSPTF